MWALIESQLKRRPGRALALLAGIAVAVSSFTVLTAASEASRLEVVGTVGANSRSAYDVLVRPPQSRHELEGAKGLVRPNFLSDHFGGITLDQVTQIRSVSGVDVAAPIAMVGFGSRGGGAPVELGSSVPSDRRSLFRIRSTRLVDGGLTRIELPNRYSYFTPNEIQIDLEKTPHDPYQEIANGQQVPVCREVADAPPEPTGDSDPVLDCYSLSRSWSGAVTDPGTATIPWPAPYLIAAVDPAAEAELIGLDRSVVSGSYLPQTWAEESVDPTLRVVPVLHSAEPTTDATLEVVVEALPAEAAERSVGSVGSDFARSLETVAGEQVWSGSVTAEDAYQRVSQQFSGGQGHRSLDTYWRPGPVDQEPVGDTLVPQPTTVPPAQWGEERPVVQIAPETADTPFREVSIHGNLPDTQSCPDEPDPDCDPTYRVQLQSVGAFDRAALNEFSELAAESVAAFTPARLSCADQRSCDLLNGADLRPNASPVGYLQQPPTLLTTLDALPAFNNGYYRKDASASAPISAVRVRVDGVAGFDDASRERVRLVAEEINERTGLEVDIMLGASRSPQAISLPEGELGRPALSLTELWTKKGVAAVITEAVDRKSLLLFVLVLVVCALFIGNASAAAVRTRRTELGILACVGWSRRARFALVLGELMLLAVIAGLVGAGVAWSTAGALGLTLSWQRCLLAIPAAIVISAGAGLIPAWSASRVVPMAAVRPAVATGRRASLRFRVVGLGLANLWRRSSRSLLGGAALALGTSALTLLVAITTQFEGRLVGSLLGDVVSVQVREADYAAVIAMLVLAVICVADVLYLNVRERAAEFATLRATGWTEASIAALIVVEGVAIGLLGSLVGAGVGVAAALGLSGSADSLNALLVLGGVTAVAGAAVAALALVAPITAQRRQNTVRLLAEDD